MEVDKYKISDKPLFLYTFLITIMFILSGIHKIKDFNHEVSGFIKKTNATKLVATIIMVYVIFHEISAPLYALYSSYTGKKKFYAHHAAHSLALFTVMATLIYHFPVTDKNFYPFMSNVTTVGALLLLARSFHTYDYKNIDNK